MAKPVAGVQMHMLRNEAERDMLGTLEQVAEIGYGAVEMAGYFNAPPSLLRKTAEQFGLLIPSALVSLNFKTLAKLQPDFAKDVAIAKELGVSYIVVPWVPMQENPSMDDVKFLADVLKSCGEQVNEAGMKLCLHNHDYEMKLVDGVPAFDRIMEAVPRELLLAEPDLGWLHMAGVDPMAYLRKYRGRVPLVHLRDFKTGRMDADLGDGLVDCEGCLKEMEGAEVQFMFVEQENFEVSSIESAKRNYAYLAERGYG